MRVILWVNRLAVAFWEEAGGPEPFPRALAGPLARSGLAVTVREQPGLTVRAVERYLARLGVARSVGGPDRPLRACLAACAGAGFLFLDAADPPDERTFSLAHELAHFLRHYRQPRELARAHLGKRAAEVLDGLRPPTREERLHSLLAAVPLGLHVHLMERGPRRELLTAAAAAAEEEADLLAWELLAPASAVAQLAGEAADRPRLAAILHEAFGLPGGQAEAYSRFLRPGEMDPLMRHLGGRETV